MTNSAKLVNYSRLELSAICLFGFMVCSSDRPKWLLLRAIHQLRHDRLILPCGYCYFQLAMRGLTPSARRVVDAPELLRLISDFAGQNDQVNLLCVSRRAFACTAASLWEDIRDITVILRLFPGVTIAKEGKSPQREHLVRLCPTNSPCYSLLPSDPFAFQKIDFPPAIDPSRFNVYSSFVKRLEIISNPNKTAITFGANTAAFFSFTQKATFAPSLTKLSIITVDISAEEHDRWVTMFLSPALLDLQLLFRAHSNRSLNSTLAPDLLGRISTKCSKLRNLEFFPREEVDNYKFEWDSDTKSTEADLKRSKMLASLGSHLSSFRNLRSLSSSVLVLRPIILSALGELHTLEKLSIDGDCCEPRIVDLVVPDSAFPVLHTLELENFHWANLRYMSEFTPLLRRLKKIAMTLAYDDNLWHYGWDADGEDSWQFKLVQSVAKNAPLLADLSIDFSSDEYEAYFTSDWLDCLRDLPLRRLDVRNAGVEFRWRELGSALPALEEFRTLNLDRETISQLAKLLPRLQLVELDSIDVHTFGEDAEDEEDEDEEDERDEEDVDEVDQSDRDHNHEGEEGDTSEKSDAAHNLSDKIISKAKTQCFRLKAAYESNSNTPIGDEKLQELAR